MSQPGAKKGFEANLQSVCDSIDQMMPPRLASTIGHDHELEISQVS